jgi:hypothetical protein
MRALPLLCLLALPCPALADTFSADLGQNGIAATEAQLVAKGDLTDADHFAIGGLRFLGAIEAALQQRWHYGLTDRGGLLPFMHSSIPENPTPAAFDPGLFSAVFRDTVSRMDKARAELSDVPPDSDFSLTVNFADVWFDINANKTRDPGEGLMEVFGPMIMGSAWTSSSPAPVVRFDGADAAWLSAYTRLVSALSDIVLAYDPTDATARILDARNKLNALGPIAPDFIMGTSDPTGPDSLDLLAIILQVLNQKPDLTLMAAARTHLLAMIDDNRQFWARVNAETDNENEWLPNDRQTSALGVALPPGTDETWLATLADLEQALKGEKLIPYWRYESGVGVNLSKIFTDPRPIDIAGWVQGWAALPYLEKGELLTGEHLSALDSLLQGSPMLMALYLN